MAQSIAVYRKAGGKYRSYFLLWWMLWGTILYTFLAQQGVTSMQAFIGSIVACGSLAGLNLLLLSNMKYYLPGKEKYLYVIVVSLALSGLWLLLIYIAVGNLVIAGALIRSIFHAATGLFFIIAFLLFACCTLVSLLQHTEKKQAEESADKRETERIAKNAELDKLRLKLQPHFLFNSLNSISALTGTQPEKARQMIQQLSEFLRGTLKNEDDGLITIEEELQQLQLYLDIEKLRFGYRLNFAIHCDDVLMHLKIPALLLQPIVENAIKFGLYDTLDDVCIGIQVVQVANAMEIRVSNPFDETTSMPMTGTGFGLSSIRRRLFLLFGRQDLLHTRQEHGNFITVVTIPQLS